MIDNKEYLITYSIGYNENYDYEFAYGEKDLNRLCKQRVEDGYEIVLVMEIIVVNDLTTKYIEKYNKE